MRILESKEFLQDKSHFNLISLILKTEDPEVITDDATYLICRSSRETPIWIWTKDDISEDKIDEVMTNLDTMFDEESVIQVTSKGPIFKRIETKYADKIVQDVFKEKGYYVRMCSYRCDKPILTKEKVG